VWATGAEPVTADLILRCVPRLAERHGRTDLDPYGRVVWTDDAAGSRSVAFHLPGFYSPWDEFSVIVAEYLRTKGDPKGRQGWRNSTLGEPYEQTRTLIAIGEFDAKVAAGHAPCVVPKWAGIIIAAADTQRDGFWWAIRAFGKTYRSRLVDYGYVTNFAELRCACLETAYPVEDVAAQMRPRLLGIDAGGTGIEGEDDSRTHEVYQFAKTDEARVLPWHGFGLKTARTPGQTLAIKRTLYKPPGAAEAMEVHYLRFASDFYKDVLAHRIKAAADSAEAWELHRDIDVTYRRQMAAEHKTLIRYGNTYYYKWLPKTAGSPNHLWDVEVGLTVLAELLEVATLASVEELAAQHTAQHNRQARRGDELTTPDGRPFLITDR